MPERFAILGALKGNRGQEYFTGLLSQHVFISQILTHRRDVSKPRQRKQLFEKGGLSDNSKVEITRGLAEGQEDFIGYQNPDEMYY